VLADKLYKVWLKDSSETWLLIHLEIQGQADLTFPERMFLYNSRAFQLYRHLVVSQAVLCDERPDWRPDQFVQKAFGCELSLKFLVVKLLDYAGKEAWLERHENPFAQVVLAQLKARQTHREPETRYNWKIRLVRGLYDRGWTSEDVGQLLRILDWLLSLPEDWQEKFRIEHHRFEEEKRMPYVTSMERLAKKEGMEVGILKGIALALESRFGDAGLRILPRLRSRKKPVNLQAAMKTICTATSLDEVRELLSKS
jgi:hypothetical protein